MGQEKQTTGNRAAYFTCLKLHAYKMSLFILILKLGSSGG